MSDSQLRIKELRRLISVHDKAYYRDGTPTISDQAYDRLRAELDSLFETDDALGLFSSKSSEVDPNTTSRTPLVGDDRLDEFPSHIHLSPMLSLDNTYDKQEFFDFDKRLRRVLKTEILSYAVEPKIDGVAVSLTFENGVLSRATTRGNGVEGDVITQNITHIQNLPTSISCADFPKVIEVRGEIFMTHDEFERINQEREKMD